ncbi:PREDICTED: uncharacterized protein LOC108760179 [Trachymyrmex cornetzi]|uniref:uncharacterized protein LOC108760179 n=1 Tax=Trachymyrmex cornetzi TaxID=471704 RepID=UPI00084EDAB8|nr:PREDICTED: uncharacterized protein LOC108760179 [Trachymyrmex cornetzi]
MEYFIDEEKYFYLILLHIIIAICIASIVTVAIGTLCITFIQHICGMFKIASYRIEYAININIQQNVMLKNKIWMIKGVIYAVDIHRKAIKLLKHFTSTFEKMIFTLIILGVACLSFNLFQVSYLQHVIMYAKCSKIINNIVQ